MEYDFIVAKGLKEEEVLFYSNLLINTRNIHNDLLYSDYIIDKITLIANEDKILFGIDMHNGEINKKSEGKIQVFNNSFKITSIIEEIKDSEIEEFVETDEFTLSEDIIERHNKDNDKNDYYEDIELYSVDELKHLFTLYTEYKMYEGFINEIINDKDQILLRNDIFGEDNNPKRLLS